MSLVSPSPNSSETTPPRNFNPEFCKLDIFNMLMGEKLGSLRLDCWGSELRGKAFSRIIPPIHRYTYKPTVPASPSTTATSSAGSISSNRRPRLAKLCDDPHFYLREDVEIKWAETESFTEWKTPTTRQFSRIQLDEDNSKILFLSIYEQICAGVTWDVYSGNIRLRDGTGEIQPIVLRLTRFNSFREDWPENMWEFRADIDPLRETVIERVIHEDWILRQYLPPLQGGIVPFYYGLFIWHEIGDEDEGNRIFASILEEVGDPAREVMGMYPLHIRKDIFECFKTLSDEGHVRHGHCRPRHILRRNEEDPQAGKFALIDFQQATSIAGFDKEKWEEEKKREAELILSVLNLKIDESGQFVQRRKVPTIEELRMQKFD